MCDFAFLGGGADGAGVFLEHGNFDGACANDFYAALKGDNDERTFDQRHGDYFFDDSYGSAFA